MTNLTDRGLGRKILLCHFFFPEKIGRRRGTHLLNMSFHGRNFLMCYVKMYQKECISVGCAPTAAWASTRCQFQGSRSRGSGVPVRRGSLSGGLHPEGGGRPPDVNRMTERHV